MARIYRQLRHKRRMRCGDTNNHTRGGELVVAVRFECPVSNNEAEYEAVLQALYILRTPGTEEVILHTDSQLVSQQILGKFEIKNERMFWYVGKIREVVTHLSKFTIKQIAREVNKEADELARLASATEMGRGKRITLLRG